MFQTIYPKVDRLTRLRRRFVNVSEIAAACERKEMWHLVAVCRETLLTTAEEIKRQEVKIDRRTNAEIDRRSRKAS
jgi:hypothetical protein